jgi:hypothetical protein
LGLVSQALVVMCGGEARPALHAFTFLARKLDCLFNLQKESRRSAIFFIFK